VDAVGDDASGPDPQRDQDVSPRRAARIVRLPGLHVWWDRYRKDGHAYLAAKPSKKSVRRAKAAVRAVLWPGNQGCWPDVVARLNRTLRGWANYFSYGTRLMAYRAIDNYVYACTRHFLRRRHKVPTRGTRRFPAEQVFGPLGVIGCVRCMSALGRVPRRETSRRAGCGKSARPVR
jgi:RNA-directed DNA polymerase